MSEVREVSIVVTVPERDMVRIAQLALEHETFVDREIRSMLRAELKPCVWYRVGSRYAEALNHNRIRWHLGDMKRWNNCPYCGAPLEIRDERSAS